jgi:hypothetical protein
MDQTFQQVHDLYFDMCAHKHLVEEVQQLNHYILYQKIIFDLEMYIVYDQDGFLSGHIDY